MATFDRYIISSKHIHIRQMSTTRKKTKLIILFILLLNILHSIPLILYFNVSNHNRCIVNSTIYLLKIDVEGFELNVLRSAERLFREKRIHHLIFEYTAWWTDRSTQKDLIPFVEKTLGSKQLYALDRTNGNVYGPLSRDILEQFHDHHVKRHLQTDIYATFVDSNDNPTLKVQPYQLGTSFA